MLSAICDYRSPRSLFGTAAPLHFVWSANFWLSIGINARLCHWVPVHDRVIMNWLRLTYVIHIGFYTSSLLVTKFLWNTLSIMFQSVSNTVLLAGTTSPYWLVLFLYTVKVQHHYVLSLYSFRLYSFVISWVCVLLLEVAILYYYRSLTYLFHPSTVLLDKRCLVSTDFIKFKPFVRHSCRYFLLYGSLTVCRRSWRLLFVSFFLSYFSAHSNSLLGYSPWVQEFAVSEIFIHYSSNWYIADF
jgi:hypothetical protein